MRIAIDAMGSDSAPINDVEGAVLAAKENPDDTFYLVGPGKRLHAELEKHTSLHNIEVIHADQVITMDDKPSSVGKDKPTSSMHVGMELVRDGKADAFVTAGNTGAAYAIAMLYTLKRIRGIKRPALSLIFPIHDKPVVFLDVGANAESRADWLAQYALMGSIYAQNALDLQNPRVGLISNGEEEGKGTHIIQDARLLIEEMPVNFIGNIEPQDMHNSVADVVVTDGFTGNIMIKTFESSTRYLANMIRSELKSSWLSSLAGLIAAPAFKRVRAKVNPDEIGGAPLLGIDGIVIIAHGSSNAIALKSAIYQAKKAVAGRVVETIKHNIQSIEYA